MTKEKYDKLLPFIWICKFRKDINKNVDYSLTYRFSKDMPEPVPNPDMIWQKPLFDELLKINNRMMKAARKAIYERSYIS